MKKISYFLIVLSLVMAGCGGTQYRKASEDKGSEGWGPREIKITVNKMVSSLYLYLKNDWKKAALIQVRKIRNRTSEHIETSMLANELVTNLLKKRIQFVDPSYTKEALKEMEKGMTGIVDSDYAIPVGELQSPNFYLYGEITDNTRFVKGKKIQYVVVTLKLKSLGTGRLQWQEQKEFLKATKSDKVSF